MSCGRGAKGGRVSNAHLLTPINGDPRALQVPSPNILRRKTGEDVAGPIQRQSKGGPGGSPGRGRQCEVAERASRAEPHVRAWVDTKPPRGWGRGIGSIRRYTGPADAREEAAAETRASGAAAAASVATVPSWSGGHQQRLPGNVRECWRVPDVEGWYEPFIQTGEGQRWNGPNGGLGEKR